MNLNASVKTLKNKLTNILKTIGIIQSSILLGLFYFLILGPTSILYRLSRLFSRQPEPKNSYWIKRTKTPVTKENLQKQY